jgi:hypothetical protein
MEILNFILCLPAFLEGVPAEKAVGLSAAICHCQKQFFNFLVLGLQCQDFRFNP